MGSCSSVEASESEHYGGVQPAAVAASVQVDRVPQDDDDDLGIKQPLPHWSQPMRSGSPQLGSTSTEGSLPIASTCVDHSPNRVLSPMERGDVPLPQRPPELERLPTPTNIMTTELTDERCVSNPKASQEPPIIMAAPVLLLNEEIDDDDHDRRRRGMLFAAVGSSPPTTDDGFCSFEPAVRLNEETTPQGLGLEQTSSSGNCIGGEREFGTHEMLQFRPMVDSGPKIGFSFRAAIQFPSDDPRRRTMSFADDMMRKPSRSQTTVSFSQMVIVVKDDGSSSPSSSSPERQPSLPSVVSDASVTAEFMQTPISSSTIPYKAQVAKRQRHLSAQKQQLDGNNEEWEWGQLEAESNNPSAEAPTNVVNDCDDWD